MESKETSAVAAKFEEMVWASTSNDPHTKGKCAARDFSLSNLQEALKFVSEEAIARAVQKGMNTDEARKELVRHYLQEALKSVSDETLAKAVQEGMNTDEAFEELVRRYIPIMTRWLVRWGERSAVEDLVQLVILRMWQKKLGSFDVTRGDCQRYLWGILRNTWLEHNRSRRTAELHEAETVVSHSGNPEQEAQFSELQDEFARCLKALPDDQRRVMEFTTEAVPPQIIAEKLNVNVAKVYKLLHQARTRMRRWLHVEVSSSRTREKQPTNK